MEIATPQQQLDAICNTMEVLTAKAVELIRVNKDLAHAGFIYLATANPQVFACALIGTDVVAIELLVQLGLRDRVFGDCLALAADEVDSHYEALDKLN